MAFPYPWGLVASEVNFLCEMELVTVIPRQRLEKLDLLGGPTQPLIPSRRAQIPLWLALLLKRQKRARIMPPAWLNVDNLSMILELETDNAKLQDSFSPPPPLATDRKDDEEPEMKFTLDGQKYYDAPPFIMQSHAVDDFDIGASDTRLPYHWLELATILLDAASDDIPAADQVRMILKELRETRMEKMRKKITSLDTTAGEGSGQGLAFTGVGGMEIGESRVFMSEVAETLRQIGTSKEEAYKERARDEALGYDDDDDDGMQF
ncbi:DNA replication protein psf2 [Ascosphaera pollenicola]|nr:DNA replication protein psf2 [Ascosphaera pollenicola]